MCILVYVCGRVGGGLGAALAFSFSSCRRLRCRLVVAFVVVWPVRALHFSSPAAPVLLRSLAMEAARAALPPRDWGRYLATPSAPLRSHSLWVQGGGEVEGGFGDGHVPS